MAWGPTPTPQNAQGSLRSLLRGVAGAPAPLSKIVRMDRLYADLCRFDAAEWNRAVATLSSETHEIDRNATRIWFAFFPLQLHLTLEQSADLTATIRTLGLMGNWRLADQVDSSHRFLYAHRFWPQVKAAIASADSWPESLPAIITQIAEAACRTTRVDRDRLVGITAIGLMTLRQAGIAAFAAAPGRIHVSETARVASPHQVMQRRAKDDWQGPFGFLRGISKRWTITFDENDPEARFPIINGREIAGGAQDDKREYRSKDPRCIPNEGPIPVECRAASCGTCWVGVIGGAEKLSPVVANDEGKRMKVFGYPGTEGERPIIRLACQAKAFGSVSIVIPPWNGMIGKIMG
jgi:ferredoxin